MYNHSEWKRNKKRKGQNQMNSTYPGSNEYLSADELTMKKWTDIALRHALVDISSIEEGKLFFQEHCPHWIMELTKHLIQTTLKRRYKLARSLVQEEVIKRWWILTSAEKGDEKSNVKNQRTNSRRH